jgi:hypothetical protein
MSAPKPPPPHPAPGNAPNPGLAHHVRRAAAAGDFKKGEDIKQKKDELADLANAIYFDFVLKKTGGGSCDHCSAAVFFQIVDADPNANASIIKYKPSSSDTLEVKSPEKLPYHRAVFVTENSEGYALDAWWPMEDKIKKLKDSNDYPGSEEVVRWESQHKEFVDALRLELEHQYNAVKGELQDPKEEVGAAWTISDKQVTN